MHVVKEVFQNRPHSLMTDHDRQESRCLAHCRRIGPQPVCQLHSQTAQQSIKADEEEDRAALHRCIITALHQHRGDKTVMFSSLGIMSSLYYTNDVCSLYHTAK